MTNRIPNIHPGEILLEEFMEPMGISQNRLARDLGVPPNRIHAIVKGKRSITADTALRLARYFGTSPEFWLGLQMEYDLEEAAQKAGKELERIVPVATDESAGEEPEDAAPVLTILVDAATYEHKQQIVAIHEWLSVMASPPGMKGSEDQAVNDYSHSMAA